MTVQRPVGIVDAAMSNDHPAKDVAYPSVVLDNASKVRVEHVV